MKKTLAFIASLVMMATAFVSCGKKDDDDESNGKKTGSSSSVDKSDDDDEDDEDDKKSSKKDKDDDEDEDDKKSSKNDKDDDDDEEEETKPSKKDNDDEDNDDEDDEDDSKPSNKSDGSIIGTWSLDEDSFDEMDFFLDIDSAEFIFDDSEIEMLISIDASDMMCIQGDSMIIDDEIGDYDYDGKVLTIQSDYETLELQRVGSADKSSVYGRYTNDEEFFMGENSKVYIDFVDDGVTYMVISMKQEYTYDEKTGILTTIDEDGYEDEEDQVEIDGDKMTIINAIDGTMTFTRKK